MRHVKKGALDEVTDILAAKPELLNVRGMWESTPLVYACQYAQTDVAAYLLSQGADSLLVNEKNVSALLLACLEGLATIVALLLQPPSPPQLHLVNAVGVVYNSHADLNQSLSPFLAACANGHLECVGLLLQAALAASDFSMHTLLNVSPAPEKTPPPLFAAAMYGHTHVLVMLLGAGAAKDRVDADGNSVLLTALKHGHDAAGVALVKATPSPAENVNALGMTALHMAADKGCIESCKALLALPGIVIDVPNAADETPLYLAAKRRDGRMLEVFIHAGADIDRIVSTSNKCVRDILTKDKRLNLVKIADNLREASMQSSDGSVMGDIALLNDTTDASVDAPPTTPLVGRKTRITFSKQLGTPGMPLLSLEAMSPPEPANAAPIGSTRRTRATFSKPAGVPLVEAPTDDASPDARLGSNVRRSRPTFSKPAGASGTPLVSLDPTDVSPSSSPRKTRTTFSKSIGVPLVAASMESTLVLDERALLDTSSHRLMRIQSAIDDDIQDRVDAIAHQASTSTTVPVHGRMEEDDDDDGDGSSAENPDAVATEPTTAAVQVPTLNTTATHGTSAGALDQEALAVVVSRVTTDTVAAILLAAAPTLSDDARIVEPKLMSQNTEAALVAKVTELLAAEPVRESLAVRSPSGPSSVHPVSRTGTMQLAPTRTISLQQLPRRKQDDNDDDKPSGPPTRTVSLAPLVRDTNS
ncbi:hypothetical protein SPRG_06709 [Saprolegnia parasitica CBS 223.65]|uniref:Uncharacterized protein n=1 Tax=Saprolegnia parasitica (strain CBS 223.65) TaxID=695850 RepID=A0A067CH04_SAPPC|nr:hypothetical protein SPRG_06709 [Saprolegnia parasitica CBS 223.65]KDO28470.1 hypothetical protein SPRG_06709 [Saprolegnia parasitica CBS 223.65]|eukprot:XP_012200909.1 hypothetical protein SPRG_06709 [Saprolegnia parasitica CBS 223.65]